MSRHRVTLWLARLTLAAVFFFNVSCAAAFIGWPAAYAPSFEVTGTAGATLVRGTGILFLMWSVTYPLAIWNPRRYLRLFLLILVQQSIGVIGETWMLLTLPPGHEMLAASGLRFVAFDGGGLVAMGVAFVLLWLTARGSPLQRPSPPGQSAAEPIRPESPGAGCASAGTCRPRR